MNIILIGMPGCGKSTVGNILAKLIGYRFLDTDFVIQNMEGKVLQDVIDEDGLKIFMTAEEKALCSVFCDSTVIATGGSAVYSERGMKYLKSIGLHDLPGVKSLRTFAHFIHLNSMIQQEMQYFKQ